MDEAGQHISSTWVAIQLVVRFVGSYVIVWLLCLAVARGDGRRALMVARRPWAMAALVLVFLAGLLALAVQVARAS